jgi:hypothetical protein
MRSARRAARAPFLNELHPGLSGSSLASGGGGKTAAAKHDFDRLLSSTTGALD